MYRRFQSWLVLVLGLIGLLSGNGCTKSQSSLAPSTSGSPQRIVNLAVWPNYISNEILAEFEKETGITVRVSNYLSNEELLAKLQAGVSGYDVAMPADYLVRVMAHLNLVEELDRSQIPSVKNLGKDFLGQSYDPENKYSLPFDRGSTGIAINRKLYSGKIRGWKDLFNQPELAGKFSLLDDMREVIGAALKSLGYSFNSTNPEELKQAKEVLIQVRKRVKSFTSEPITPLAQGEMAVAHAFMTDALQARKLAKGSIEYIHPEEGEVMWMDTFVIPKGALHKPEAHALINFLLGAKASAYTATNFFVSPANLLALPLLPETIKKDP